MFLYISVAQMSHKCTITLVNDKYILSAMQILLQYRRDYTLQLLWDPWDYTPTDSGGVVYPHIYKIRKLLSTATMRYRCDSLSHKKGHSNVITNVTTNVTKSDDFDYPLKFLILQSIFIEKRIITLQQLIKQFNFLCYKL